MRFAIPMTMAGTVALLFMGSAAPADEGHGHHDPGHGGHAGEAAQAEGLAGAWAALEAARDAIAADVAAGLLKTIHEKSEPVPGLAKELLEHSDGLDPVRRKRVEGAVRQLPKVADALHDAADGGDLDGTRRELKRLDGLLQLIRAQYPSGALPTEPSHQEGASRSSHGGEHAHGATIAEVADASQATVQVVASDFTFEPRELMLRAGEPTRLEFRNEGAVEHVLIVKTLNGATDAVHLHAQPGETDAATVRLDGPGRYVVVCTIPGHQEIGMIGELVVTDGSSAAGEGG